MIPWVCIFYSFQDTFKARLVYRGNDFEKKTKRDSIIDTVIKQGLGDISDIEDSINKEIERCMEEGVKYSMAIYYNHVLVEADVMNNIIFEDVPLFGPFVGSVNYDEVKQVYFELQNLYQDVLK